MQAVCSFRRKGENMEDFPDNEEQMNQSGNIKLLKLVTTEKWFWSLEQNTPNTFDEPMPAQMDFAKSWLAWKSGGPDWHLYCF